MPAPKSSHGFVEKWDLNMRLDSRPYAPAPYDKSVLVALKSLGSGSADSYQQMLALEWLMQACGTYDMPFRPGRTDGEDGRRLTDFALGKQWVGQQIVKLINMPMPTDEQGEQR